MTYPVNNLCVFIAALVGYNSGLIAARNQPTDPNENDYSDGAERANFFAQAIDTEWGTAAYTNADLQQIENAATSLLASGRSIVPGGAGLTAAGYTATASAMIAGVKAGTQQIVNEGLNPNGCGGGGGFIAGGDLFGSSSSQEVIGILNHQLPPLTVGYLQWNGTSWVFSAGTGSFIAAGDLSGSALTQEVVGILSHTLPAIATGYLNYTGSAWAFTAFTPFAAGGDLSGTATSQEVVGILSHALPSLSTGYIFYNGSAWVFQTPSGSFAAGGDLSGSASVQEVIGLLSHALPSLSTGYLNYTGSAWALTASTSIFTAGGDLSGSATSQEVVGLLSHALPSLSTGYLNWTGSAWALSSTSGSFTAGGDLSGSSSSQEVIGILSHALPSIATGYLYYSGSAWVFQTPSGTFTAGGDLSGSSSSQEVVGILSHALPSLTFALGAIVWTGSSWIYQPVSSFSAGGDLSGSASTQAVIGILSHTLPSLTTGFLNWTGSAWAFSAISGGAFSPGADIYGNGNSTSTLQYVSGISYNGTGTGGAVTVSGTNTYLNWVNTGITLQYGGVTQVLHGAASTDFDKYGPNPATAGFIRFGTTSGSGTLMALSISAGTTSNILYLDSFNDLIFGWSPLTGGGNITGNSVIVQGQNGLNSGSGGNIQLNPGGTGATGTPGSVFVNLTPPTSNGAEPVFEVSLNGVGVLFNVQGQTNPLASFGVPIGGIPATAPLQFAVQVSPVALTPNGSITLSAAQYSNVIIPLTVTGGSLGGLPDTFVNLPNVPGSTWFFDVHQFTTTGTGAVVFTTGAGTYNAVLTNTVSAPSENQQSSLWIVTIPTTGVCVAVSSG
jgi:hypothetical protein